MRKVKRLDYNWHQIVWDGTAGEEYKTYEVGDNNETIEIEEHPAMGEGDKWFYYVRFVDGSEIAIFNPNKVYYEK